MYVILICLLVFLYVCRFTQACSRAEKPHLGLHIFASAVSNSLNVGTHVNVSVHEDREVTVIGGILQPEFKIETLLVQGSTITMTGVTTDRKGNRVDASIRINANSPRVAKCLTLLQAGIKVVEENIPGYYFLFNKDSRCN